MQWCISWRCFAAPWICSAQVSNHLAPSGGHACSADMPVVSSPSKSSNSSSSQSSKSSASAHWFQVLLESHALVLMRARRGPQRPTSLLTRIQHFILRLPLLQHQRTGRVWARCPPGKPGRPPLQLTFAAACPTAGIWQASADVSRPPLQAWHSSRGPKHLVWANASRSLIPQLGSVTVSLALLRNSSACKLRTFGATQCISVGTAD